MARLLIQTFKKLTIMLNFIKRQTQTVLFVGLIAFFTGLITTLYLLGAITDI